MTVFAFLDSSIVISSLVFLVFTGVLVLRVNYFTCLIL